MSKENITPSQRSVRSQRLKKPAAKEKESLHSITEFTVALYRGENDSSQTTPKKTSQEGSTNQKSPNQHSFDDLFTTNENKWESKHDFLADIKSAIVEAIKKEFHEKLEQHEIIKTHGEQITSIEKKQAEFEGVLNIYS